MKFSFLTWNVRHFRGNPARAEDVDDLIEALHPDIFGLIEFKAKDKMRDMMLNRFPEYDFGVTDSRMGTELIVGWKRSVFQQAIFTQKRDFFAGNPNLRPGGLLSVNFEGEFYNLLYLHTKSGTAAKDYDLRQTMYKKIWKLNTRLGAISTTGNPNLIVLGDLNTMGRTGRSKPKVSGSEEIQKLAADAVAKSMKLADKDQDMTWSNWGRGPRHNRQPHTLETLARAMQSNLDHVVSSDGLDLKGRFPTADKLHVLGWNQLTGQDKIQFLFDLSDHSAIYGAVQ